MKRGELKRTPFRRQPLGRGSSLPTRTTPIGRSGKPTDPKSVAIIAERSGGRCEARILCNGAPADDPQHVVPRSQGRNDAPENLLAICRPCHIWAGLHPKAAHLAGVQFSAKWEAQGYRFGSQRPLQKGPK